VVFKNTKNEKFAFKKYQIIEMQLAKATVLLIDNNITSYLLVSEILGEYGINLIHARCELKGVNLYREKQISNW
jgi:hypothetical protein